MYKIMKLDQGPFKALIIKTDHTPFHFPASFDALVKELESMNIRGRVLVDSMVSVGNNSYRFFSMAYDQGINAHDTHYEVIPENSIYRELSCNYLREISSFTKLIFKFVIFNDTLQ